MMRHETIGSLMGVLLFLLLSGHVHAFTVDEYSTNIVIDQSGNSIVTVSLTFDSTGVEDYISLPAIEPIDIDVSDRNGSLKFATFNGSALVRPNENIEDYNIVMRYTTASLTSKNSTLWKFNYVFNPYEHLQFDRINRMHIKVDLPRGSKLKTFSSGGLVAAEGDYISVQWVTENKKIENPIAFEIEYLIPPDSGNSSQNRKENSDESSWKDKVLALFVILLSGGILFGYKYKFSRRGKKEDEKKEEGLKIKDDVLKSVIQTQRTILVTLADHGGHLRQKELEKETGLVKSTLSRNLHLLKNRNIVSMEEGIGKRNEIRLREWILET
jgi:uncharacterized membrane protein